MASIRAFIAIELADGLKRRLAETQNRLQASLDLPIRWTPVEGVHLTLKFLGDIDPAQVEAIHGAMAEAVAQTPPFTIGVGALGAFPSLGRLRVLWLGVAGDLERLAELQRNLEHLLERLGFAPEGRAFAPHLTLGRVRGQGRPRPVPELARLADAFTPPEDCQRVDEIVLVQSELRTQGAVYSRLRAAELGRGLSAS